MRRPTTELIFSFIIYSLKNSQCFKNKTRTHMQSFKIWFVLRDPNSQTQQQKCIQNSKSLWQKRRTKFIKTILEKLQKKIQKFWRISCGIIFSIITDFMKKIYLTLWWTIFVWWAFFLHVSSFIVYIFQSYKWFVCILFN